MRRVRVTALVLLAVLTAAACGARLSPELRKQASTAALNAGSSGTGTGPQSTGTAGPNGPNGVPGVPVGPGGGTQGSNGTQGTQGSQGGTQGAASGCNGATDVGMTSNSIVLGNVSSTSGPVSGLFEGAPQGAQAFAAFLNSQGGLCGHNGHIQFSDDSTNCQGNQNATEELASKVFAFLGSFSLEDGCGAKYLNAHTNVPDLHVALAPEADNPPNHFDIETGALGYATGPFAYYAKKLGAAVKSVGTLYANVGGAVPKQKAFEHAAKSVGWNFVYSRATDASETDWVGDFVTMCQRDKIKIFFTGAENAQYAAKMVNDERQAGCPSSLINIIPIAYDQAFVADVGNTSAIENLLGWNEYSLFFNADEAAKIPELKLLQGWFSKANPGKPLNLYALFAWASGRLFQQAFQAAGAHANRASLMEQLRKINQFTASGIVAPMTPSDKKGGVKCYILWQVHGGKFSRVDDPATGYRCDGQFLPLNG